jgi:PAS domain S-box-containing protein
MTAKNQGKASEFLKEFDLATYAGLCANQRSDAAPRDEFHQVSTGETRISHRKIQLFFDALPIASCMLDAEGRIRFVSATMPGLFGYAPAELLGQPIGILLPPDMRARHEHLHARFLAAPERRSMVGGPDTHGLAKDGTRLPLEIGLSPLETAEGRLVMVMFHDLRGIRQAEAERDEARHALAVEFEDLRNLHRLATRLVGAEPLPVLLDEMLAAVMGFQHADFGNIRLLDAPTQTLTIAAQRGFGASFLAAVAVVRAEDDCACGRALEGGRRVVIRDVEADAAFAPYRAIAAAAGIRAMQSTPIRARDGSLKGVLSTHFAVPHVPADRELRLTDLCARMVADLIERVEASAALQAARLAAEQANQMKTRFLSAAGHDLRQPLQTMGLLKAVLERQIINPRAFGTLAKLGDAVEQMQDLIDTLLDASQIERGAVPVVLEPVSLGPLLARLARSFIPMAEAKGLELRHVPHEGVIRTDARLLTRLLGNLLSNAIKYTDHGRVLLGCRRRGGALRLEVWDTGIGIAQERARSIFGEFERGDQAGNGRAGLGLGLYIVQRFADLLGGRIELCSMPGKGSMFALVLPAPAGAGAGQARGGLMDDEPLVVLVEPDSPQREALIALLRLEGYQAMAFDAGPALLAHLPHLPRAMPLVIAAADHGPGGMDGLELVTELRVRLTQPVPAVILASREPSPAEAARAGGNSQFITRPFRAAQLLAAMESAVRQVRPEWRPPPPAWREPVGGQMLPPPPAEADIAIIDDDASLGAALHEIFTENGRQAEIFTSAEAFLAEPGRARFKCLVVDVNLPGMSGFELQARLNEDGPAPKIVFLSGHAELPGVVSALQAGAADFLRKPVNGARLLESVTAAIRQTRASPPDHLHLADVHQRLSRLTRREREVMVRVVRGELNKNIAADLGVAERTIEHHRQNMMQKMGARSLAALVRMVALVEGDGE